MQKFNNFLVEGKMSYDDFFKRNNKQDFISKAVAGTLVDVKGKKIPPIDPNSELIGYLSRSDAENNDKFKGAFVRTYGQSLTALSIDKIANGYSTTSGKNASGSDWEDIITSHYNRLIGKEGADADADEKASRFDDWHQSAGESLAKAFIETLKDSSVMTQYGKGSGQLSQFWVTYGGSNATPKTDMFTNEYNISLKKAGGSQLASSAKGETIATYNAALEYMGEQGISPEMENILNMIENGFQKVTTKLTVGELDKLSKKSKGELSDKDKQAVATFTETQKFHTELNKEIKKHLNFHDQPDFLKWYTFEAMSGYKKFKRGEKATASICMEFDADKGRVSKVIQVTSDGKNKFGTSPTVGAPVVSISKKVKVYAAFKSAGGNPQSTLRLGVVGEDNKSFTEITTLAGIIKEEVMNDKICNMLVEDIYQLDEFAIIKKAFSKLKKIGKDAKLWFNSLLTRIMERVKKVFEHIKNMGAKMYEGLFGFLNIKVDKVKANMPKELEGFI